jgi:hypothetical protein
MGLRVETWGKETLETLRRRTDNNIEIYLEEAALEEIDRITPSA